MYLTKASPNWKHVVQSYRANSNLARQQLTESKHLRYGVAHIETANLYTADQASAPIQVFIHGGDRGNLLAEDSAFAAEMFVGAGAHFIVLDLASIVETACGLQVLAEHCRNAIAWIYRNAESFDSDPNRIYISGHSCGALLCSLVLVTDWEENYGLPKEIVKGGLVCSGIFDLKPARLLARNKYLRFNDEIAGCLSSQRSVDKLNCPVVVAYGTLETPELLRQSRDFVAAAKAAGKAISLLVADGYNHFEVNETMGSPYGLLGHAALEQMKLLPSLS